MIALLSPTIKKARDWLFTNYPNGTFKGRQFITNYESHGPYIVFTLDDRLHDFDGYEFSAIKILDGFYSPRSDELVAKAQYRVRKA